MSNSLKLWLITVRNPLTNETITFYGQGTTVMDAVVDGVKNCGDVFRPNQSGSQGRPGEKGGPRRVAAQDSSGAINFKSLREFEADPEPAGETLDFA